MKISTEINSAAKIVGEERAIECIAQAGFDAWDFSMFSMFQFDRKTQTLVESDHPLAGKDYLRFARHLRKIGEDHGLHCNQSHAPFPNRGAQTDSFYKRAIECTAEAGGGICVIHPVNRFSAEQNAEIYFRLLPFAKSYGVKIATENMWNWNHEVEQASAAACSSHEDFKAHLDAVNDDFFVACLDIGHAEMRGLGTTAVEMIHCLGEKLQALHVHDNDRWKDLHQLPYSGQIDFQPILAALKEIGYQGYLTLEADTYLKHAQYESGNVLDGIKNMAAVAKKMSEFYEALS